MALTAQQERYIKIGATVAAVAVAGVVLYIAATYVIGKATGTSGGKTPVGTGAAAGAVAAGTPAGAASTAPATPPAEPGATGEALSHASSDVRTTLEGRPEADVTPAVLIGGGG